MRKEFRKATRTVAVTSAMVGAVLTWVVAVVLYRGRRDLTGVNERLVPLPVAGVIIVGTTVAASVLAWYLVRKVADWHAARVTQTIRQVTQRADEYGTGRFDGDPGQADQRAPFMSDLDELVSLSRVIDRTHDRLGRALTGERTFAVDASHQLKTPLSALLLRLEEIQAADDLQEAQDTATIAISQTERLAQVVTELLDRTRAGHADGGMSVSLDMTLPHLIRDWEVAFTDQDRNIRCVTEKGITVQASASAFSQIMNTLMENALNHGAGMVTIRARRSGPSAVIEVADEGHGINPETAVSIFKRGTSHGNGTGIGLAVAKETAASLGGRLELTATDPTVFGLYVSQTGPTPKPVDRAGPDPV